MFLRVWKCENRRKPVYAIGLPGLIADNIGVYEALALSLARDPQKLDAIRATLKSGRDQAPLFNTDLFARNFEAALLQIQTG